MDRKRSILSMLLASTSFAFMAATVKLSGGKVPLMQQIFFRNLVIWIFAYIKLKKEKISFRPEKSMRKNLLFRCIFGFTGMICVFYANRNLLLADAQILQKLSPFFITLFAVLFLREKLHKGKIISLIFAFLGAVIVIRPHGDYALFPFFVGLASAVLSGLAYTFLRKLHTEPGMRVIFWFSTFSVLASLPMMIFYFEPLPIKYWVMLLMIGVFAGGGQYFITKAYHYAPASEISIFDYTGVVISPMIGYFLFQEHLSLRTGLGMVLIVLSGYLSYRWNKAASEEKALGAE